MNGLKLRDDAGMLWENFMVTERLKRMANLGERKIIIFGEPMTRKKLIGWRKPEGCSTV